MLGEGKKYSQIAALSREGGTQSALVKAVILPARKVSCKLLLGNQDLATSLLCLFAGKKGLAATILENELCAAWHPQVGHTTVILLPSCDLR